MGGLERRDRCSVRERVGGVRDGRRLLVLWDIDNTLIANGGVSKLVYSSAFFKLTGCHPIDPPKTAGRTDPEIVRNLLLEHGRVLDDASRLEDALAEAMFEHRSALVARGFALPGAHQALAALHAIDGMVQSVLTGNIRRNAHLKLAAFDLDPLLDLEVGAYGSDDSARSKLVAIAQRRAGTAHGENFDRETTVLIGDTPRDVRAGIEGGARVVAVATGVDSVKVLTEAGADVVLESLADTEQLLRELRPTV